MPAKTNCLYIIYEQETGITQGVFDTYRDAADFLGVSASTIKRGIERDSCIQTKYYAREVEINDKNE